MIKDIIELIKKSRKRRKDIWKENKRKYWKLTASERLHYDSIRVKISEDNRVVLFGITFGVLKLFFYIFVFLGVIKFLFELDLVTMVKILTPIIGIIPMIFKLVIFLDIFLLFITRMLIEPTEIRRLNKNYGFK